MELSLLIITSAIVDIIFVLAMLLLFNFKHPLSTILIFIGLIILFIIQLELIERKVYEGKRWEHYYDGQQMRRK